MRPAHRTSRPPSTPGSLVLRFRVLAEREGFEPSRRLFTPYSLSRRAPSTTRPPLQASPPGRRRKATRWRPGGVPRREWDSNPRDPSQGPTVFKTVTFVRSVIPPRQDRAPDHDGGRGRAPPTTVPVAEGVGFEPTRRRQPPTAFRVPRTRPDYATPPSRPFGAGRAVYRAEGAGFEPARGREPPTAFPVPRTRPDYAIPPNARTSCPGVVQVYRRSTTP